MASQVSKSIFKVHELLVTFDGTTDVHAGIAGSWNLGRALAVLAPDLRFDCLSLVSAVADPQLKSSSNVFPSIEHR